MIPDEFFDVNAPMYVGKRFYHECSHGKDKALVITRTPEGWKWYCHRCGERGRKETDKLSPSEVLKWHTTPTPLHVDNTELQLPDGFTFDIPDQGLAWLYHYGISDKEIDIYGFGFSRVLNRVILPVYNEDDKLVYWQGRTLGKVDRQNNPKYLNIKARGREDIYFRPYPYYTDKLVLVEDILSAVKVSRIADAIGLLYAYIPERLVLDNAFLYKEIVLWLDKDKWNRMQARVTRYRSFGLNVTMVQSEQDPKFYTDDEIENYLWG